MSLTLPTDDGGSFEWTPTGTPPPQPGPGGFDSRSAFAAVHVAADPRSDPKAGGSPAIDWDQTLAYRHYLSSLGLGVAEAMDTAQRGGGVGWETARELILRTASEGSPDPWQAKTLIRIVEANAGGVSGIKVSLLDSQLEVDMRERLPGGVSVYTGGDLHYVDLILGDENGHSDALLGVFDPIAPVAAAALQALHRDDMDGYRALLEPTVPFARHLFGAPTFHYKTGVVFLAYLNGRQSHFRMVGGMETARSLPHLAPLLVLADEAGLLREPELAAQRMRSVLELGS